MKLRTEINVQPFPFHIDHQSKVMLMGSCFTQNIGSKLRDNQFETLCNPYGITFNPLSLSKQIVEVVNQKHYTTDDLIERNDHFVSFSHHSSFNRGHKYEMLVDINESIDRAHHFLKEADVLIVSIGTAWVWGHMEQSRIVNNCHKIPAKEFELVLTKPEHIYQEFAEVFRLLDEFNPKLQIVFTISPVRHWRSGAVENSRSKSVLISSVHDLVDAHSNCHYFPSYEIMIDDLRDYRFFEDDLIHPSDMAIEYIWSKFGEGFFNAKTVAANSSVGKVKSMMEHRPFNPEGEEYQKFLQKLELRKEELEKEHGISIE